MEQKAIDHMNSHHGDIVEAFCKSFGNFKEPTNIKMTAINQDGMQISCDQGVVFVPFLKKANTNGEGYKDEIVALYSKINSDKNKEKKDQKAKEELIGFIDSFKSVIISSLNSDMMCVGSYAPFVRDEDSVYICLSSVAEHYRSIKANPNKVSLLFLQDEKEAKTVFARVRLSVKCDAEFINDEAKRDEIFNKFIAKNPNEKAIGEIRNMKDFHIVKMTLKDGRFVKGFGAAYDTKGLDLTSLENIKTPHQTK